MRFGVGAIRFLALVVCGVPVAQAQQTLSADQVLVVYDSRIADSLAVAEHYAGSASVPGGAGGEPGARPGVRVFDLATGAPASTADGGTVLPEAFRGEIRDPIRAHILGNGLEYRIRCLVLCKGLPHRIGDPSDTFVGDTPSQLADLWVSGNARLASVDADLTLLWHDLDTVSSGGPFGRTIDTGYHRSPYWRRDRPINTYSNANILREKAWDPIQTGRVWRTSGDDPAALLTPGDIVLVCRLDGNSVADVRAMVERAASVVYDPDASAFIIDESGSNGIADEMNNGELDNILDLLSDVDDYETARDLLLDDGRFDAGGVRYNALGGVSEFQLGPNVDFGGVGMVVTDPVVLLTHFGRNHAGRPTVNIDRYEESFNLAPGAVFNTLESYNGRAFNGIGTRFQQAQVADFISAGGTFGIGMVWEPLAQTVPDTNRLVRTWFLGRLTWAEAAYTAIPTLSWMHVVIGDPLARAIVASEDVNGDGVLDVEDLYAFRLTPVDLNRDGSADDTDFRMLADTIRGPEQQTFDAGRGDRDRLRDAD